MSNSTPSMTDISTQSQPPKPVQPIQGNVIGELVKNMEQRLNEKKNIFKKTSKDYPERRVISKSKKLRRLVRKDIDTAAKSSKEALEEMIGTVDKLKQSRFEKFYQITKEISKVNL